MRFGTSLAALLVTLGISAAMTAEPKPIAPAVSTSTGLLLQPPLDLSKFTTTDFQAASATVGAHRIRKAWTTPVVSLPAHARASARGLTEEEVRDYMRAAKRLFDAGDAVPISDVGLISTQEDVIRRPMLNHIAAFSNAVARVYLLVQRTTTDAHWGYFSIVQDLTLNPPMDYFGDMNGKEIKFEGVSCYKCHSSGPLAIHPAREDLVSDPRLAAALSLHIAEQPLSRFYFPSNEVKRDYGPPAPVKFCAKCHDVGADRLPLFRVHSHPIRVLVDFGYMPPNRRLKPAEIAELKTWLESKP